MNRVQAMKRMIVVLTVPFALLVGWAANAQSGGGIEQHLAALKNIMVASQQDLRTYQWVETTTVSVNGQQKAYKEESCYYGADGSLQKVPIASSAPPPKKFGFRGMVQSSEQSSMTDTMKQAVALVKSYVPPIPFKLDQAKQSGNVSFDIIQPGQVVRLNFKNYNLPGDVLGITLNIQTNRILEVNVSSYLGSPSSPVTMATQMGTLMDGSTYPARTELSLPSSNLEVDITNTGYRKNGM